MPNEPMHELVTHVNGACASFERVFDPSLEGRSLVVLCVRPDGVRSFRRL